MTMSRFDEVSRIVLGHEGGLVDDPADKGGRTNLGVTQGTLDRARGGIPSLPQKVDDLTVPDALLIYRKLYWEPSRCEDMPEPVDLLVFDASINCGVGGAGLQLQRALNTMGAHLKEDGAIGPATLNATIEAWESQPWRFLGALIVERTRWHNHIVSRNKSQIKFLNGWISRIVRNAKLIGL
jgi:lysozyme family protein